MDDPHDTAAALDPRAFRRAIPRVTAVEGLLVEVASSAFVGAVVACTEEHVSLADRRGRVRRFTRAPGAFIVDERRVELTPTARREAASRRRTPRTTNSGSLAVAQAARTARAGRILVEGVHDAELVEQVWGDDLRVEGVVVEVLHGADDLARIVEAFDPTDERRLGVLLDHLVEGSKESRLATAAAHPHVLVTGHPFVDIWSAVRPEVLGIDGWPDVPRDEDYKRGVATRLGYEDPDALWAHIRRSVTTWRDLDRALIRAVEELIDFVTAPAER